MACIPLRNSHLTQYFQFGDTVFSAPSIQTMHRIFDQCVRDEACEPGGKALIDLKFIKPNKHKMQNLVGQKKCSK